MFVAASDSNLTIFGIGQTADKAIEDAYQNCFHSQHPVILETELCVAFEVVNANELKQPLSDDDLLDLEVVPLDKTSLDKCKLVPANEAPIH